MRDLWKFLSVIRDDIYPMTVKAVLKGNNLFGAAVLDGKDLSPIVVGTNLREDNPTYHGEMVTIDRFYRLAGHPDPADTVFLSTHEPCPMCLSALAWAGFREIYYLFDYGETADDFSMPTDREMLEQIFRSKGTAYRNSFFSMYSIRELAQEHPERDKLLGIIAVLKSMYLALPVSDMAVG